MPGFDREIARNAQRVLINPRSIDWHTGVLATKVTPGMSSILWVAPSRRGGQRLGKERQQACLWDA